MPSIASNYIRSDVSKRQKGVPLHFDSTVISLVMKNTKNKGSIASWIHSYFDNVMTNFMINNRTDA